LQTRNLNHRNLTDKYYCHTSQQSIATFEMEIENRRRLTRTTTILAEPKVAESEAMEVREAESLPIKKKAFVLRWAQEKGSKGCLGCILTL